VRAGGPTQKVGRQPPDGILQRWLLLSPLDTGQVNRHDAHSEGDLPEGEPPIGRPQLLPPLPEIAAGGGCPRWYVQHPLPRVPGDRSGARRLGRHPCARTRVTQGMGAAQDGPMGAGHTCTVRR